MSDETKRTRAKGWGAVSFSEKIVLGAALMLAVAELVTGLDFHLPLPPLVMGAVVMGVKAARAALTWKAGVDLSTLDPRSAVVMLSVFVLTALVPSSVPPTTPVPAAVGPALVAPVVQDASTGLLDVPGADSASGLEVRDVSGQGSDVGSADVMGSGVSAALPH